MDNEITIGSRFKHAWNAFRNRDPTYRYWSEPGSSYYDRPDRVRVKRGNERSIINAINTRISIDASLLNIQHCKLDSEGRFSSVINSELNNCLTVEANLDQTGKAFIQDAVMSVLDEGTIAIVPVETTKDPSFTSSYDILSMRVGKVKEWFPSSVRIDLYNERTGDHEEIVMPKRCVAIVENPLYSVMNAPNSTMQRLIRKLNILDAIDEQSGSGKLDLIIGLPYQIKSDARRNQAEKRRKDIEEQLAGSKFGIAYTDSTERITQLNRPVENNLMQQIEYLTNMLYSQLGITQSIMDGSADEKILINFQNRTVDPIVTAILDEMSRKFLSKTARSQRQTIMYFRDPLRSLGATDLISAADTFTRNEILSKNEIRQKMGYKPSDDPKADQLINSNIAQPTMAPDLAEQSVEDETGYAETPKKIDLSTKLSELV